MALITIKNLHKRYGTHPVLQGLNLEIQMGETLVILGRSGVGKSVLLRHIIALEKPDEGEIFIENQNICDLEGHKLFQAISQMGMLFQGGALFDSMNVYDNVAFYLNQHGDPKTKRPIPDAEIRSRVEEALSLVGLENAAFKLPSDLSGGMRKRAALARLIAYRPRILLYDEPTTGLDPITAMQINDLIVKTQKELKATSIVVTHDLNSALFIGNRLAFHHEGVIAHVTDKADFLNIQDPIVQKFLKAAILPSDIPFNPRSTP